MAEPAPRRPDHSAIVAATIAVFGLMTTLCGGCTAFWLTSAIGGLFSTDSEARGWAEIIAVVALIIGGIPTLIAALVLRSALRSWRGVAKRPAAPGASGGPGADG